MKVLNLVYPEKSDIAYILVKFPDGQQSINVGSVNRPDYGVEIKARLNDFKDLEVIICATQALRGLGVKEIALYCPYFLGSRSDRKFEDGSVNYLKEVICPIINGLNFASVTILDPHSDVLEACLNNFIKDSNKQLINFALSDIYTHSGSSFKTEAVFISPDAGASKKIYKVTKEIGYTGDIIICSKDRDKDGKLTETNVGWNKDHELYKGKDFIIIDDICDGGKTFINIAEVLKAYHPKNRVYLIVTHGIFSKGFSELDKYFDGIYCTNSYQDLTRNHSYNDHIDDGGKKLIKQFNVF